MRVLILGAGAVGSLFGARFGAAGHSVALVGRADHVAAIRQSGVTIEGERPVTIRCTATPDLEGVDEPEAVVVTVKTFDLAGAVGALARSFRPTPTLLTQNGLGVLPAALATLRAAGWIRPESVLVRAVHSVPATLLGPGRVRAAGAGEVVLPSPSSHPIAAGAIDRFVALFHDAGIAVRTVPSIDWEEWRKAVVNAAINPVTALERIPNGALRSGRSRVLALALLREAVEVARADGVDLDLPEVAREFDRVVEATHGNRSSMLQDLERGRPTEIDAISGEIVRRAETHAIDVPTTRDIVRAVRAAARSPPPQPS